VAAVDQVVMVKWNTNITLTYLRSTPSTGWSTAGVADSNLYPSLYH